MQRIRAKTSFKNSTPVGKARKVIEKLALQGKGTDCPCCGQYYNGYSYNLHKNLSEAVIKLVRVHERTGDWVHVSYVDPTRHLAKAKKWGLVEQKISADGTPVPGYWKPTKKGNDFVYKHTKVPSHVFIVNNQAVQFSTSTTNVIKSVGGRKVYEDLMSVL